jgi:hypothetical protein
MTWLSRSYAHEYQLVQHHTHPLLEPSQNAPAAAPSPNQNIPSRIGTPIGNPNALAPPTITTTPVGAVKRSASEGFNDPMMPAKHRKL